MRPSTTTFGIFLRSCKPFVPFCAAAALFSGCAARLPSAPPPVALLSPISPAPLSTLRVPVEVDLDYARDMALKSVPKPLSQGTTLKTASLGSLPFSPAVGIEFRHRAELQGLDLRLDGNQLQAVARVAFSLGGSVKGCGLGANVVSCGEKPGEQPAVVDFTLRGTLAWAENGKVDFRPQPWEVRWLRSCELTAVKVRLEDVLDLPVVRERVQTIVGQAVQKIPESIRIRPLAERAWKELDKPRDLLSGERLVVRPESLSVGPLSGTGKTLRTSIVLKARPSLTDSVVASDTGRALPVIGLDRAGDGPFQLEAQAVAPLSTVDSLLSASLSAHPVQANGRTVRISKARLYGAGDKAVLGITLLEPIQGEIFLTGHPVYDSASQVVRLADLDFDLNTSSFLAKSANFFLHGKIQSAFAKAAEVDIKKFLPKLSDLKIPVGEVGEMHVSTTSLRPVGISLDQGRLRVWLRAEGSALMKVGAASRP
jgi:hypothetical protein